MRAFGLIGYPLTHSFSKKYFIEKFVREGVTDARYDLFDIPAIEMFPQLLSKNPFLKGLNVTIPYKQKVIEYITDNSNLPAGLDACNCIRINDHKLQSFNTDIVGFETSMSPYLKSTHDRALVLGNGGATAAVIHVLKKLKIPYSIVSRELHGNSSLTYNDINADIMSSHRLIINTSPVGTFPAVEQYPLIPYQFITSSHYLYDLVYNPLMTAFLQKGLQQGAFIRNGEDMLSIQAEASWKIWNE